MSKNEKTRLVLLHGALGSSAQFNGLQAALADHFDCFAFDFYGHGGKPMQQSHFSIHHFAEELTAYLNSFEQPLPVFGYSMGGYVATYAALHLNANIHSIFSLGTKWFWNTETAEHEIKSLNPDTILKKVPAFAKQLEERHAPLDWKDLLKQTARLMSDLGQRNLIHPADMNKLAIRSCFSIGDRDKMVSLEETRDMFRSHNQGSLCVLPDTPHPIEKVELDLLKFHLIRFFKQSIA